jgi:hypothetical protein
MSGRPAMTTAMQTDLKKDQGHKPRLSITIQTIINNIPQQRMDSCTHPGDSRYPIHIPYDLCILTKYHG